MNLPFIIAEIGSNWKKSEDPQINFDCAIRQISAASLAGADAVKFQLFKTSDFLSPSSRNRPDAPNFDEYSLPEEWLPKLAEHCAKSEVWFMCTAFSVEGYEKVAPFVDMHKVASPEFHDLNIRKYLAEQEVLPVIYSLGCAESRDLNDLLQKAEVKDRDIFLECISEYPAKASDYNLFEIRNFVSLAKAFRLSLSWGVSDHTKDLQLAIAAREQGATFFEKHVDFFPKEGPPGPDSEVSIGASDFKRYCSVIKAIEPIDYDIKKRECRNLYGRRLIDGGYFRE